MIKILNLSQYTSQFINTIAFCMKRKASFFPHEPIYLWKDRVPLRLINLARDELKPMITIIGRAHLLDIDYVSFAYYRNPCLYPHLVSSQYCDSDKEVQLDLDVQRCVGGSFSGKDSQGLFWSLNKYCPDANSEKAAKMGRLVTKKAIDKLAITLEAYNGYVASEEILTQTPEKFAAKNAELLCSTVINRVFCDERLADRIEIEQGRIRSVIFRPKNLKPDQKVPAIITLAGNAGGILDQRAGQLVHEGYITMSLPFFRYRDLPATLDKVDMDYFEEAIDIMLAQPNVMGNRVSVIGLSKGAEIVTDMAVFFPHKLALVVPINGFGYRTEQPRCYRGKVYHPEMTFKTKDFPRSRHGMQLCDLFCSYSLLNDSGSILNCLPIFEADPEVRFLFVQSGSDHAIHGHNADLLMDVLEQHNRANQAEILHLPGAGHLLELPYLPLCRSGKVSGCVIMLDYGGFPADHHAAQILFSEKLNKSIREYFKIESNSN